jgi:hypothetical protein
MGWKTINVHRYYYKPERDSGSVKTTYFGAGESAMLVSLLEAEDRDEKNEKREHRRAGRKEYQEDEKAVSEWFDGIQAVADVAMIAAGFQKHKRSRGSRK